MSHTPNVIPLHRNQMHIRPSAGRRITVYMKDGSILHGCNTTLITSKDGQEIIIYHKKKDVNEMLALCWAEEKDNA